MTKTISGEKALSIDEHLGRLAQESARLDAARINAQQKADSYAIQVDAIARRISAIQIATTALKGLPPLSADEKWREQLIESRKALTNEVLALPPRVHDAHALGVRRNLELSIRTIDCGPGALANTGYELTTLRLGELMRRAGYQAEILLVTKLARCRGSARCQRSSGALRT